ncbi:hypothetical protein MKX01_030532, partial [Papaver californicum]
MKVGNNVDCFPDNGKWSYCGKALNNVGETELPKFTLHVAQKSHHTKLFKDGGCPENVPA